MYTIKSPEQNISQTKALCRFCAKETPQEKLIELKNNAEKSRDINLKLTRLNSAVNFNDDFLPTAVCLHCCNSLQNAYNFVMIVEQSRILLINLISSNNKSQLVENNIKIEHEENNQLEVFNTYEDNIEEKLSAYKQENILNNDNIDIKTESHKKLSLNVDTKTIKINKSIIKNPLTIIKSKKLINKSKSRKDIQSIDNYKSKKVVETTWKDYNWKCSKCETVFQTYQELTDHSIKQHNQCNTFSCLDCKRKSTTLTFHIKHVKRKHSDMLKWSCYHCFEIFHTQSDKTKHLNAHYITDYICPGCNTCFVTSQELEIHKKMYYKPLQSVQDGLKEFEGKFCGLTCLLSNKSSTNIHVLLQHLIRVHTEQIKPCICEICGKRYTSNRELSVHMATHCDLRPFKCEICPSMFKVKALLLQHIKIHDPNKRVSCENCGKEFQTIKLLRQHKTVHSELFPYVCDVCNKSFRRKPALKQHTRQHTGEKPYCCEICNRHFTCWPNFHKHMTGKHGKTASKKKLVENNDYSSMAENGKE